MTTNLSIVVISHNIENFIEQALRSCFFEGSDGHEIIVVDNGSTDETLKIIQRVGKKCPAPFRIISNPENYGPGHARNQGLDAARGDRLLYLDGDDWFRPNTYERLLAIVEKLDPDIIEYNHARAWDTGRFTNNINSNVLRERDVSPPQERAVIMENFGVVWNKLYRTEFLRSLGVRFALGIYEDVSWSFAVKMNAQSYYVIPDVLVNYRQRSGSITRTREDRHIDIISEYRVVLGLLKSNGQFKEFYGRNIYDYGRKQILNVANSRDRLVNATAHLYMKDAEILLSEWRKELKIDKRDVRLSLLKTGDYRFYRAAHVFLTYKTKVATFFRKTLPRWARQAFLSCRKQAVLSIYNQVFCRLPVNKKKVLLESYWGRKADCNPLAIGQKLLKHGGFQVIYSLNHDALVPEKFPFETVRKESLEFYRHAATAKYIVSNTNITEAVRKRPNTIQVQTWHGTPIKVMGVDIRPFIPKEMNWTKFAERSRRWDYVLSSNPHSSYAWRRACPYNYKLLETGYPRNDILFDNSSETVERIKTELRIPLDKKVAVYAPTVRDALKGKMLLTDSEIFHPERIVASLGEDWVLLMRSHYFHSGSGSEHDDVFDVSNHPVSNEICLISDLLITDYSSIMFDYACLKRPIVLYTYDYDEYNVSRGVYFDIRSKAPGAVTSTQDELVACLSSHEFASADNYEKLRRFNEEFCSFDDGYATDRVLAQVFGMPQMT